MDEVKTTFTEQVGNEIERLVGEGTTPSSPEQPQQPTQVQQIPTDPVSDEDLDRILDATEVDLTINIPDPEMLVSVGNTPLCTRNNFSVIIGQQGARKSFLCTAIAGAFVSKNGEGCIGLDCPNGNGRLLWIDTEQADGHVARIKRRLHRIAGLPIDKNSDNIFVKCLREYKPDVRKRSTFRAIERYKPDFVVIDGLADLITDTNDNKQSSEVVTEIMATTKKNNCHVLTVIHANPGSEKARGHLGSECLRKSETAILAEAKGEVTLCRFLKTRDIRPNDFAFMVHDGLPIATDYMPPTDKSDKLYLAIKNIMPEWPERITYADLVEALKVELNIKERAAETNIEKATDKGYIKKISKGVYSLPPKEIVENEISF